MTSARTKAVLAAWRRSQSQRPRRLPRGNGAARARKERSMIGLLRRNRTG
jgi:hypothetical protein